jgi:hypothetical protein
MDAEANELAVPPNGSPFEIVVITATPVENCPTVGDLVALMATLGETSAVIVGHDLGAWGRRRPPS